MPTTIDSAGITFNDATSLTSANIGTAQLVNGSVTAAKLGTTEQKQIAKAWVNFNGAVIVATANATSSQTISCNSGSNTGTFVSIAWDSTNIGTIYKITQINGVTGATLGGVDVSTLGIQIISVSGSSATFRFLSGTTTSAQSVTGTGSSSSGFSFISTGIRSSYNVSSVTKTGTGNYILNFSTAFSNTSYAVVTGSSYSSTGTGWLAFQDDRLGTKTVSQCYLATTDTTFYSDSTETSIAVFLN
jgi:hypothetical protein